MGLRVSTTHDERMEAMNDAALQRAARNRAEAENRRLREQRNAAEAMAHQLHEQLNIATAVISHLLVELGDQVVSESVKESDETKMVGLADLVDEPPMR